MENQFLSSQNGSELSLLDKLSQLEAENKALSKENARLRSSNQNTIEGLEEYITNEQALKESRHRFETIFEKSILGKKIIGDDLRILQVNPALQAMLGYSQTELVGTRI